MNIEDISKEYQDIRQKIDRFCAELTRQINILLREQSIPLGSPIMWRTKSWESIFGKMKDKSLNIEKITELEDLAGLRLLLLFKQDLERVRNLIRENFHVVSEEDTGERLGHTQFGYQSRHMTIKVPDSWFSVPTNREFAGLVAELQIRTLAQHIWAAVSHELQYKREESVPIPVRRSIHRVSALLETVDLEFERVLEERSSYISFAGSIDRAAVLNVDLLDKILREKLPAENYHPGDDLDVLLRNLFYWDIRTVGSLLDLVEKHLDTAQRLDKRIAEALVEAFREGRDSVRVDGKSYGFRPDGRERDRCERGVFKTHMGLVRTMLEQEFNIIEPWSAYSSDR